MAPKGHAVILLPYCQVLDNFSEQILYLKSIRLAIGIEFHGFTVLKIPMSKSILCRTDCDLWLLTSSLTPGNQLILDNVRQIHSNPVTPSTRLVLLMESQSTSEHPHLSSLILIPKPAGYCEKVQPSVFSEKDTIYFCVAPPLSSSVFIVDVLLSVLSRGTIKLGSWYIQSCRHGAFSQFTFTTKQACVAQKCFMKDTIFDLALEVCVGLWSMERIVKGIPSRYNKASKGRMWEQECSDYGLTRTKVWGCEK